jgi:p-aminobenzoyl-glutamate transporter AbgT
MAFDSFGAVIITLVFVVPGFIYGTLLKLFTIPEKHDVGNLLVSRFTFSC